MEFSMRRIDPNLSFVDRSIKLKHLRETASTTSIPPDIKKGAKSLTRIGLNGWDISKYSSSRLVRFHCHEIQRSEMNACLQLSSKMLEQDFYSSKGLVPGDGSTNRSIFSSLALDCCSKPTIVTWFRARIYGTQTTTRQDGWPSCDDSPYYPK